MNIEYIFEGKKQTLTYDSGKWSGGHPGYANALNNAFVETVGRFEYYPTPWHKAKHVADTLGGTLDTPEPPEEDVKEGEVY